MHLGHDIALCIKEQMILDQCRGGKKVKGMYNIQVKINIPLILLIMVKI
jgi:hypothetical protein